MPIPTRFTGLIGCRHPLQQAAMGGSASPALAVAVAEAGALGMISGSLGVEALRSQLDAVPADLVVGVNFIAPFLDPSALEEASTRSRYVELFWAEPDSGIVDVIHQGGALAGWQVGSSADARQAEQAGCDVVIVQGVEAGGHVRGTVGLLDLLAEAVDALSIPVVAAGGIGTGRTMAAVLTAGAEAVRVGTRFLAANESFAHPAYVAALVRSGAEDTILTTAFDVGWPDAPHRVLKSAVAAGKALGDQQVWSAMWPTEEDVGPVDAAALYAGQSVGAVRERQPAGDIVRELVEEAEKHLSAR